MSVKPDRLKAAACAVLLASLAACGAGDPQSMVRDARVKLDQRDAASAAVMLKSALQKNPQLAEARFLLGRAALAQADHATAEAEFKRALELKYSPDEVVPQLALAIFRQGAFDRMLKEIGPIALSSPRARADVLTAIGNAHVRLGREPEAARAFGEALLLMPGHYSARLGQARMIAVKGQTREAAAAIEAVLAQAKELPEAWELKGMVQLVAGQVDDALAAWRRQLALDPDDLPARARLVSVLIDNNRLKDAGTEVAELKRRAGRLPQTAYFDALLAYRERRLEAAREAIVRLERSAPDYVPGVLLAGLIDQDLKAYQSAQARFERILASDPGHVAARRALVTVYLRTNQGARAAAAVQPLIEARPDDAEIAALAGEAFLQGGKLPRAMQEFARAAKLKPGDTGIGTRVALSHFATGNRQQGFAELESLAASQDADHRPDLTLIAARLRARDFDKALAAIDALEKKMPGSSLPANLRGAALLGKGEVELARRSFEKALQIRPDDFGVVMNLAQLDLATNAPQAALARLEAVVKKDRKNIQAALGLAELRGRLGASADEIAAGLEQTIAAVPTEPAPRIALIALRLAAGDKARALAASREAMAAMPERVEMLEVVARAHEAAGELTQAIGLMQKIATLQAGSPHPWLQMAALQARNKDFQSARQSLVRAQALAPDLAAVGQQRVAVALAAGDEAEALAVARKMQTHPAQAALGFILETDIHAGKREWDKALASARAGLKVASVWDLAVRVHAGLLSTRQNAEAAKFAEEWMKAHPEELSMPLRLAELAASRRDFVTARRHYEAALKIEPSNPVLLNNLAWVAGRLGEPDAVTIAERALKLAPQSGVIMDTLGVLLLNRGDALRALELLQKAVRFEPNTPAIRLNLARALIANGKRQEAQRELDVLAALGDRFRGQDEVAQLRKKL